jgi:hypothetical protein
MADFEVTLCGQCSVCQHYFPCEQLFALQVRHNDTYQDTSRFVCFECQRGMNLRAYQVRELTRDEVLMVLQQWLAQRHHLTVQSLLG